jgi:DNA repair protein RecO (recombination protein O)
VLKKIDGIIVNVTDYGETSKIINILTPEGIIGAIAKGAKSLKSPLRSFTINLTYGTFTIYIIKKINLVQLKMLILLMIIKL